MIHTVRGPIAPEDLGPTLPHEHVMVDFGGADVTGPHRWDVDEVAAAMLPRLQAIVALGITGFVDCSPAYLGRDPGLLAHLSAAAGLFVWPDPGPVLANYGLDNLRFATPTYPGDEIRVLLTCKEKSLRAGAGYGEVRWDAQVLGQTDQLLASYDLLTMVAERGDV